jgi:hypothetical protein
MLKQLDEAILDLTKDDDPEDEIQQADEYKDREPTPATASVPTTSQEVK